MSEIRYVKHAFAWHEQQQHYAARPQQHSIESCAIGQLQIAQQNSNGRAGFGSQCRLQSFKLLLPVRSGERSSEVGVQHELIMGVRTEAQRQPSTGPPPARSPNFSRHKQV